MVLLDEEPAILIAETTNEFRIDPDKESLSRLSSNLSALKTRRTARLGQQQALLKALSRQLNTMNSQYEYEQGRRDTGQHASEVLALDGEKFRIAKAVNEVEAEEARLESELAMLSRQGVSEVVSKSDAAAVLKLQVYRSLGVEIDGSKAIVRNKKEVSVLDVEGCEANDIWQAM